MIYFLLYFKTVSILHINEAENSFSSISFSVNYKGSIFYFRTKNLICRNEKIVHSFCRKNCLTQAGISGRTVNGSRRTAASFIWKKCPLKIMDKIRAPGFGPDKSGDHL